MRPNVTSQQDHLFWFTLTNVQKFLIRDSRNTDMIIIYILWWCIAFQYFVDKYRSTNVDGIQVTFALVCKDMIDLLSMTILQKHKSLKMFKLNQIPIA